MRTDPGAYVHTHTHTYVIAPLAVTVSEEDT